MTPSTEQKSAAEYGREALAQWRDAARFGARALAERKAKTAGGGSLKDRLPEANLKEHLPDPGRVGGGLGDLADSSLAKMGFPGKLASKVGVGHRVVNRLLPDSLVEDGRSKKEGKSGAEGAEGEGSDAEAPADDHLFDAATPLPIQESIDVAVPVAAVFDLCRRFEDLPRFSDRIEAVEVEDDTHVALTVKISGHAQTVVLEIVGEEPEERLDWDGIEGVEHSGVVTFHPLAPRLTRIELTIEQQVEGLRERLLRRVGHPERVVRQELRRFKAYAELWDEANDYKSADFKDPGAPEDDGDAEPPEDEAAGDEEDLPEDEAAEDEDLPEGEDEPADDEDLPDDEEADEPLEDDQEAEPAAHR